MRYLLIDDLADQGWKSILEKAIIKEDNSIVAVTTFEDALIEIKEKWDFIFLDMRMDEQDHKRIKTDYFSGFKILKEIKENFTSINFSTPIILITASNKIWNINRFQEYGIDAFYIKEHPDFFVDEPSSKENLNNLQDAFKNLITIGKQRSTLWTLSKEIINIIESHYYFEGDKRYANIKARIIDKLKLGYTYSFRKESQLEKNKLNVFNEAMAFIVYWSIFEEIVKAVTDASITWNNKGEFLGEWKFRNKEYFIERTSSDGLAISITKKSGNYIKNKIEYTSEDKEYGKYEKGFVNLSEQVYAIIAAHTVEKNEFVMLRENFKELNSFRNKVDFIHSSVINIYKNELISEKSKEKHFEYSVKTLKLINNILKLI